MTIDVIVKQAVGVGLILRLKPRTVREAALEELPNPLKRFLCQGTEAPSHSPCDSDKLEVDPPAPTSLRVMVVLVKTLTAPHEHSEAATHF